MTTRFVGRRLPGALGGLRVRCALAGCSGNLSCLAGHPTTADGEFIDFGYGAGGALSVRESTVSGAGLGLFAGIELEPQQIIITYDGHVSDRLYAPANAAYATIDTHSHLHTIPGTGFVVWGFMYPIHGRGLGSFCNHSRPACARVVRRSQQFPYIAIHNCPDLRAHIVVMALRHIHVDEEITITYSAHTCARLGIEH